MAWCWRRDCGILVPRAPAATAAGRRLVDKILQVVDPSEDRRWMETMIVSHRMVIGGMNVVEWRPRRRGAGPSYPVYQYGNIRTDVGWTLLVFLLGREMMMRAGATVIQAEYVACSSVIELVGVNYGQPSGTTWGFDPSDFGFATPNALPVY